MICEVCGKRFNSIVMDDRRKERVCISCSELEDFYCDMSSGVVE